MAPPTSTAVVALLPTVVVPPTPTPPPATATPVPEPTSTPTPVPARSARVVNTEGQGANMRRAPSVSAQRVKLVAEPCRIWLWLTRRERYDRRRDALVRAADLLPDEREAIGATLALHDALPREPEPPLNDSLAALVRLSALVVAELAAQVEGEGVDEVRLVGGQPLPGSAVVRSDPGLLPLADWRACVLPGLGSRPGTFGGHAGLVRRTGRG